MGIQAKLEYLNSIIDRYRKARRKKKKAILDEFCMNCGYNRKYAIRILGMNDRWKNIRRLMSTHCYATIVLPTKNGKTYRIRKASAPDDQQTRIYQIFGIDWKNLPKSKTLQQ